MIDDILAKQSSLLLCVLRPPLWLSSLLAVILPLRLTEQDGHCMTNS